MCLEDKSYPTAEIITVDSTSTIYLTTLGKNTKSTDFVRVTHKY